MVINLRSADLVMKQEEKKQVSCEHCRHELQLGEDVIRMDNGVIGPRGFIDLGKAMFFCNEDCLKGYCEDISTPQDADPNHAAETADTVFDVGQANDLDDSVYQL